MTHGKRTIADLLLLSAVAFLGVACGGDDPPPPPPDTSDITGPRGTAFMTADVATMPGAALWALATDTSIWSDSVEADRLCAPEVSECNKQINTKKVRVRIWAHKEAKDIHDSATGPYGALVAKMENVGDAKERMYGLERDNVYLLFIYPGADTSGVYRLFAVSKSAPHRQSMAQTGTQIRCNHQREWQKSWGTFVSCAHGPPTPPPYIAAGRGFSLVKTAHAASVATSADSPPAWITCPSGCCTSGHTLTYQLTN